MPLIQNQPTRERPPRVAAPGKENEEYVPLAPARPAYTYPKSITTPAKLIRRSRTQRRGRGRGQRRGRTQRRGRGRGRN